MAPSRFWAEWTWRDFELCDMRRAIAVLPVAAIEQHGPHLPCGVDSFLNEAYVRRSAESAPDDLPVLFLPVQTVGVSPEHAGFPGTLTLRPDTVIRAWTEIGDSIARTGCRKLIIMNSHGGNGAAIEAATVALRMRWRMLAVHTSWRRLGFPESFVSEREKTHGVHGGDAETSLTLAVRPDLVREEALRDFPSAAEAVAAEFELLRAKPPIGFAWAASDLNPDGAVGEADRASAEKGEEALAFGVAQFHRLLRDIDAFDLSRLAPGPLESSP